MKLPQTIKRFVAGASLIALTTATSMALITAPVMAAETVQMEGAIYAANVTNGDTTFNKDGVNAKSGDTVAFEVYYHNMESADSGKVATNVRIKVDIDPTYSTSHDVDVHIKGDNTNQVDATTSVDTGSETTQLQFLNASQGGSVTWRHNVGTNAAPNWVTSTIADNVVTSADGAIIETAELPCNNFSGTLVFKAKLVAKPVVTPPAYSCDAFNITADVNRKVKISSFKTSATNGATFTGAVISWGDQTAAVTSPTPVGLDHQYAKDGTYTVSATAHFNVNGVDQTAGGVNCAKTVTFTTDKPPVVTPPTTPPTTPTTPAAPTRLVNTGAGSTMGMFAAVTVAGTFLYRRMLTRRLSQQ